MILDAWLNMIVTSTFSTLFLLLILGHLPSAPPIVIVNVSVLGRCMDLNGYMPSLKPEQQPVVV